MLRNARMAAMRKLRRSVETVGERQLWAESTSWPEPRGGLQLAEVAATGPMVRAILTAIHRFRAPPSCA
jgi:hypothetical protein